MKKIIAIVAFGLLTASQAFGAASVNLSLTSTGKSLYGAASGASASSTLIGKTSTGVGLGAKVGQQGYAMFTQHKSGNRAFGTSFDSTSVFYKEVTVGTAVGTAPAVTSKTEFSSWTSM